MGQTSVIMKNSSAPPVKKQLFRDIIIEMINRPEQWIDIKKYASSAAARTGKRRLHSTAAKMKATKGWRLQFVAAPDGMLMGIAKRDPDATPSQTDDAMLTLEWLQPRLHEGYSRRLAGKMIGQFGYIQWEISKATGLAMWINTVAFDWEQCTRARFWMICEGLGIKLQSGE